MAVRGAGEDRLQLRLALVDAAPLVEDHCWVAVDPRCATELAALAGPDALAVLEDVAEDLEAAAGWRGVGTDVGAQRVEAIRDRERLVGCGAGVMRQRTEEQPESEYAARDAREATPAGPGGAAGEAAMEHGDQVVHAGVALLAVALQAADDRGAEPLGERRRRRRMGQAPGAHGLRELSWRVAVKGAHAEQRLVECDAEAELVAARIGFDAHEDLRGDVTEGAGDEVGDGW